MKQIDLAEWLLARLQGERPLNRQLHDLLLEAVLQRVLPAGTRLPSTRLLAQQLGVARNTVIDAYDNLTAQGCLGSRRGSGHYVIALQKETPELPALRRQAQPASVEREISLSVRGQGLVTQAGVAAQQWGALLPGVPDVSAFPTRTWLRLLNRHWRLAQPEHFSYAPAGGLPALREVLAQHLRSTRAVQCEPEQVILTSGSHQAVDLVTRLMSDPGDLAWLEDPCYWGLRSTLSTLGLKLQAIPVDAEGLRWPEGGGANPKLVLVTPSHQYPLGMVMSLARRQHLLTQCRAVGAWIVEDDYDSEFRYTTRPIASLQGMGPDRVFYVGSFSKTMFPGLRVGYLVVPRGLAARFAKASAELYREGQLLQQATLADFLREGHLAAHVRRVRTLYAQRRTVLIEALGRRCPKGLHLAGDKAGLHLVAQWEGLRSDLALAAAAQSQGVQVRALSRYYVDPASAPHGLVLGYAATPEAGLDAAVEVIARLLDARP